MAPERFQAYLHCPGLGEGASGRSGQHQGSLPAASKYRDKKRMGTHNERDNDNGPPVFSRHMQLLQCYYKDTGVQLSPNGWTMGVE
eukprot:3940435-Rhodomonas_salina.2